MFKNLKISAKLMIAFGATTLLMLVAVAISSHAITKYRQAVESMHHAEQLKAALDLEEKGVLQLLGGIEGGAEEYAQAHELVLDLQSTIKANGRRREQSLISFIHTEQQINRELFATDEGFFEDFDSARAGFVEKNNKHVRRVLGYRNGWVVPKSGKDDKVLNILDNIRRERILIEDFNPRSPEANNVIQEFRGANGSVVASLVALWQEELDLGIDGTTSPDLKLQLQTTKKIVSQITATSYPPVSPEDAAILGIEPNSETLLGLEADHATSALTGSCKERIADYEANGGAPLWLRADVPDVGENVTPVLTLGKIVSCQQGLRVNAEDIFRWQSTFLNDIEPKFDSLSNDINVFRNTIFSDVSDLANLVQYLSVAIPVIVLILVVLLVAVLSKIIVKPILALQEAAVELAGGNLDQRVEATSKDEIGTLGKSFNHMAENLQEAIASRDEELTERKRAEEALGHANLQLEEARQNLEERVKDRTQDLETSNSQLLEAQNQLLRTEKLAAIGQLAGGVAHDLRNPLGAIKNAAYYLNRKLGNSEEFKSNPRVGQFLTIIDAEADHSNKIVTDLLTFARLGPLSYSPVYVGEIIENTLSSIELVDQVHVIKDFDPELPEMSGDGDQLQRVFTNLILNAQEAMTEGGDLTITTRRQDEFAEVAFQDTGMGMTAEVSKNIFEPLFTTKNKGTGLGLAICQQVVARHGGTIDVVSAEGQGTTFTVKLPVDVNCQKEARRSDDGS